METARENIEVFFKNLPEDCVCPICAQALREPYQLGCGHHYCKICLETCQESAPCSVCHQPILHGECKHDKKKHREIQELSVFCSHEKLGCKWEGCLTDLEEHVASCEFEANRCENCGRKIPRVDFLKHVSECEKERVKCEFCEKNVRRQEAERHLKTCSKVLISCPFQCGLVDRTREEIELHRPSCPNVDNVCPFIQFGCNFAGDKESVQKHLSDEPIRHIIYLCDQVADLKMSHEAIFDDLTSFSTRQVRLLEMANTCNQMFGAQLTWRIDNMMQRQNDAKSGTATTILSTPFMSSRNGYKMVSSACLFGDGTSRGKNLSLYVALMRGEYDGMQEWPFSKTVKITLLDQNPVATDRVNITYKIDPRMLKGGEKFLSRPRGERNAFFGAQTFCSLSLIDNYIKEDAMFIRVEVERSENAENIFRKREKTEFSSTPIQTTRNSEEFSEV
ncbi:unnamed protein product [Caenorhabditis auriculariae]|uniref:Uncharacterized protein n=1 Tax=Caenorhabditis auriculariae TaxID=2777116 RepID=A0A8S1HLJ2_9PELO|nr:unnamed protein product [Caenorhabditis auriculariae]